MIGQLARQHCQQTNWKKIGKKHNINGIHNKKRIKVGGIG